ncbi:MAG TPA: hypothetical protein VK929_00420 [Longimicrobiales bacterium]|nr:hypothetical protein [Longimicrobiales bacterium]
MTRARLLQAGTALAVLAAGAGLVRGAPGGGDLFPHAVHERLFPVCESCHAGVFADEPAAAFPQPAHCRHCHDGVRADSVAWTGAAPRVSNLRFSHGQHGRALAAAGEPASCQACHARGGEPARMDVGAATAERCIACHEHSATTHMALPADCSRCHLPLDRVAELSAGRIARFPRPPWHEADDFILTHATTAAPADASCGVCHARQTCERCHANASALAAVMALPQDTRVAQLERGRPAVYPLPAGHAAADWHLAHGTAARAAVGSCANCHTRPSCTACHAGGDGRALALVAQLPPVAPGAAPGVDPARITRGVHGADVRLQHGRLAASGQLDCAQCHARAECSECHAAADSRAFHLPNFVERHAVDVFTGRGECQACHSTDTFCRACHAQAGIASGDMKAAFHDGQPMWVLSHGRAARLGLEACASCHRQSDCVQCHSAAGGWGVNPHGPGFTGRGESRSAASCRLCHLASPPRGSGS